MRTQQALRAGCAAAVLGLLGGAAGAQESQDQPQKLAEATDTQGDAQQKAPCPTAHFSQDVLTRFPQARKACLYLTSLNGEPFAVYRAEVVKVHDDGVEVRFKMPDGGESEPHYIRTDPELRVQVQGQPVEVKDLAVGQDLVAYVKVREPVMELQQPGGSPPKMSALPAAENR